MAKDKSVILYCDYLEQFEDLSDAAFGGIVRAILRYNLGEGEPHFDEPMLNVVFKVIKRSVDKANAHYEEVCRKRIAAGKKSAAKRAEKAREEQREQKQQMLTKAGEKDKDRDKEKEKDKDRDKEKDRDKDKDKDKEKEKGKEKEPAAAKGGGDPPRGEGSPPEPPKHLYGRYQNVALSDGEYEEICEEFPLDYEERIEKLSEYMSSTGKRYRNYLATLRSWRRRERENNGGTNRNYRPKGAEEEIYSDDIYEVF